MTERVQIVSRELKGVNNNKKQLLATTSLSYERIILTFRSIVAAAVVLPTPTQHGAALTNNKSV